MTNESCVTNNASCPCGPYDVLINGTCTECMIENCLLCDVENVEKCDICEEGYKVNK